jgi:hypothetical protein
MAIDLLSAGCILVEFSEIPSAILLVNFRSRHDATGTIDRENSCEENFQLVADQAARRGEIFGDVRPEMLPEMWFHASSSLTVFFTQRLKLRYYKL